MTSSTSELEPLVADTNVKDCVSDNVPVLSPVRVSVTTIEEISIFPVFDTVIV